MTTVLSARFHIFLLVMLAVLNPEYTIAQFNNVASSAAFTEPEEGFAKILLLKNGNTFYGHIREKGGIVTKIFDANHKEIGSKEFATTYGDIKKGNVQGCFEVNGDVTILIMEMVGWSYAMYRVIIDGNTGEKKEEIVLRKLEDFTMSGYKDVRNGNATMPEFIVRKDPHSENYAVGISNSTSKDKSKRINLIHFDKYHKEISNVYLNTSLFPEYEFCNLVDLAVHGDKEVQVLVDVFKRVKKEKEGVLKMVKVAAGKADPNTQAVPLTKGKSVSGTTLLFNHDYSRLFLLAMVYESREGDVLSYSSHFMELNTATSAFTEKKLEFGNVLSLVRTKHPKCEAFNSIPIGIELNQEGGVTVLSESIEKLMVYGDVLASLGNIIVSNFDASGNLTYTSVVFSYRKTDGQALGLLYYNVNEQGAVRLKNGNQYKFFKYLQTAKGNFLVMNDMEDNDPVNDKGEVKRVFTATRSAYAYYYKLGDPIPARNWFYPKPDNNEHPVSIFPVSDYNMKTNIFCTTQLDHGGGGGKIKLVWLQPS